MVSLLFPLTLEINSSQSSQRDHFKRNTFHSHLCSKSTDSPYPLRICETTSRDLHNQASLSVSFPLAQFPCLLISLLFPKITIYALALMNTIFCAWNSLLADICILLSHLLYFFAQVSCVLWSLFCLLLPHNVPLLITVLCFIFLPHSVLLWNIYLLIIFY